MYTSKHLKQIQEKIGDVKMKKVFYKFEEYLEEGEHDIVIIPEVDFIENDGQLLGISDTELLDFLHKHDLREMEENIFQNVDGLTEEQFLRLFANTPYQLIQNDEIY